MLSTMSCSILVWPCFADGHVEHMYPTNSNGSILGLGVGGGAGVGGVGAGVGGTGVGDDGDGAGVGVAGLGLGAGGRGVGWCAGLEGELSSTA